MARIPPLAGSESAIPFCKGCSRYTEICELLTNHKTTCRRSAERLPTVPRPQTVHAGALHCWFDPCLELLFPPPETLAALSRPAFRHKTTARKRFFRRFPAVECFQNVNLPGVLASQPCERYQPQPEKRRPFWLRHRGRPVDITLVGCRQAIGYFLCDRAVSH